MYHAEAIAGWRERLIRSGVFGGSPNGKPKPIVAARAKLKQLSGKGSLQIYERVDLRAWSPLGVGGPADLLIRCDTELAVQSAANVLATFGIPWFVVGAGSSLVFADAGIRVPIISLGGKLATWEMDLDGVAVSSRANVMQVRGAIFRAGLVPPKGLGSVPGSMGGWLQRAIESSRSSSASKCGWLRLCRPGREAEVIEYDDAVRDEEFKIGGLRSPIIISARLELTPTTQTADQPVRTAKSSSWGSGALCKPLKPVFASENGIDIDRLLKESGCTNLVAGAARPSSHSLNYITTASNARARDVLHLCREMRSRVLEHCGVNLRPTLRFVNEDGTSDEV